MVAFAFITYRAIFETTVDSCTKECNYNRVTLAFYHNTPAILSYLFPSEIIDLFYS